VVVVMTYNPYILFRKSEPEREFQVAKVISSVSPDILLVQELAAATPEKAIDSVCRLADMTNMQCRLYQDMGEVIFTAAKGSRTHAIGILWNQKSGVTPISDSWHVIQAGFWHAIARLTFKVSGILVDHAVYHGPPRAGRTDFNNVQQERNSEARIIAELATQSDRLPLLVGADWNYLSADTVGGNYYAVRRSPDNLDPNIKMLAQSREAGKILLDAGLFDVSAAMFDPQIGKMPTTGHWSDYLGAGIIDGFKATHEFRQAILSSRVTRR